MIGRVIALSSRLSFIYSMKTLSQKNVKNKELGLLLILWMVLCRYSHSAEVQVRLQFLTCVFSTLGSPDHFSKILIFLTFICVCACVCLLRVHEEITGHLEGISSLFHVGSRSLTCTVKCQVPAFPSLDASIRHPIRTVL